MGLIGYLKPGKKGANGPADAASESEKTVGNSNANPSVNPSAPATGFTTPRTSRPPSIYPNGDFRNSTLGEINDIKCDVMVNYLHQQQLELMWSAGGMDEGVILKKARNNFTCCPPELANQQGDLYDMICELNVRVCIVGA